jgi:hypothetical protein
MLLGIPVIGSWGASIAGLVVVGADGELVHIEDHEGLADAILRVWRGDITWDGLGFPSPSIFREMEPACAAGGLAKLARVTKPNKRRCRVVV